MFVVYFENSKGEKRKIGNGKTEQEARTAINSFLNKRAYKSYYWNVCKIDEKTVRIDVGSWSEFFYIVKEN